MHNTPHANGYAQSHKRITQIHKWMPQESEFNAESLEVYLPESKF
jgi:hypothetical protein